MERPELIAELAELRERVDACGAAVSDLVRGISDDEFSTRPGTDSWSMCECIDHLIISGTRLCDAIDVALAQAHRKGWFSRGPFRYGRIGNWFVRQSGGENFPNRRRIKTLKLYSPQAERSVRSVLIDFDALQTNLSERIEASNGIDLARVRFRSPAAPLVRLQLGQWLALLVGHQERHLMQAREAREAVVPGE